MQFYFIGGLGGNGYHLAPLKTHAVLFYRWPRW